MNRFARLGAGPVLTACLLAAAPPAPAQQPLARVPFEGSQLFRQLLHLEKLTPLTAARELNDAPEQSVLIVLGDPRGIVKAAARVGGLAEFRRQGGAILVATDADDKGLLAGLGVHVSGHSIWVPPHARGMDGRLAYDGDGNCPVLYGLSARQHPLFRGLNRGLVTNYPSDVVIRDRRRGLSPLASFPGECRKPEPYFGNLTLMAGGAGRERVLIIADRTLFTNNMLALPGTDNWKFAENVASWLSEGGRRKYVLFIEDGRVVTNFNVPLAQVPMPPLKLVGKMVRLVEEKNLINRAILENIPRERIVRFVFLCASGLLLLYGLFRLVRAHHRGETAAPLVAVKVGQGADAELPLAALRGEAALREGNCYEAARDLARLCFEGEGGERPTDVPPVVHGGRRLRREVERLWRLAYGATPARVSPAEFAGLAAAAARVRAALDDGSVHGANGDGRVAQP